MDRILEHAGRTFGYLHLGPGEAYSSPFGAQPYVCLVWDADGFTDSKNRQYLADAIIASNCRYVVCGGAHCEAWHDAMDEAFLELELKGEQYEEQFVMTSWHTDQLESEVALFFVHCTASDEEPFTKYLVLQVGGGWDTMSRLKSAVQDQVSDGEADDDGASMQEDV
jgi:hypothetical protein